MSIMKVYQVLFQKGRMLLSIEAENAKEARRWFNQQLSFKVDKSAKPTTNNKVMSE